MNPWDELPELAPPIALRDVGPDPGLDALDLPDGSALTIAKVVDGKLHARRWRDTGSLGFYPASTVKLVTAVMLLDLLEQHGLTVASDLQLGTEPRVSIGHTLTVMIRDSGNEEFNTLQESVGFAETDAWLKSIGVETGLIRRHFTRPHWNSSRPIRLWNAAGTLVADLPQRPSVDFPPNAAGGQSNWFTTDDLVRVMAAVMQGPTRGKPGFDVLAEALRSSTGKFVGDQLPQRYTVYNKVGWWPPDGAYSDIAYVHDVEADAHFYLAVFCRSVVEDEDYEPTVPREIMGSAAQQLMEMIDAGKLTF